MKDKHTESTRIGIIQTYLINSLAKIHNNFDLSKIWKSPSGGDQNFYYKILDRTLIV